MLRCIRLGRAAAYSFKFVLPLLAFALVILSVHSAKNTVYLRCYMSDVLMPESFFREKKKTSLKSKFNFQPTLLRSALTKKRSNPNLKVGGPHTIQPRLLYGVSENRDALIFRKEVYHSLDYIKLVLSRSAPYIFFI
jgi:hypothetical protein